MKAIILCAVLLVCSAAQSAAADSASQALQKGLFEEEANQNPKAAIEAYQSVLSQFEEQRRIAATAAFRLGECYRKLGRTNEAFAQFERVLREFGEQGAITALSRKYLIDAGRGATASASGTAGVGAAGPVLDPAQAELVRKEMGLVQQQIDEAKKKQQNGRASTEEVIELERQLIPLERKLPENAEPSKQKELIQREIQLVRQLLDPAGKRVRSSTSGPTVWPESWSPPGSVGDGSNVERHPIMHQSELLADLIRLQRELADVQQSTQTQFTQRLNTIVRRAAAPEASNDEETKEIQQIIEIIKNSPDLVNDSQGGATRLHNAAAAGRLRVAEYLLDNHADVNALGSEDQTPLHYAAMNGHKAMVELLLNRGANVNAKDRNGGTPLHVAASRGFQAVAQVLLQKGADVNARGENGTPLLSAVAGRHKGMVELLLANKADINATDAAGQTPLIVTTLMGQAALTKFLLEHGADPNVKTQDGRTALTESLRRRTREITEILLTGGADPNFRTTLPGEGKAWVQTPLHYAVGMGDQPTVQLLLEHGAKIDARDEFDRTPLHWAVERRNLALVNLLLEKGADPNVKDSEGKTPLTMTLGPLPNTPPAFPRPAGFANAESRAIFDALVAHGANLKDAGDAIKNPFMDLVSEGSANLVEKLIELGADANLKVSKGYTPLHSAAATGNTNMVQLLISKGANVNTQDERGNTPLHYAAFNSHKAAVALLLEHGAKTDVVNQEGHTPEQMLAQAAPRPAQYGGGYFEVWGIPEKQQPPGGRRNLLDLSVPAKLSPAQAEIQELLQKPKESQTH